MPSNHEAAAASLIAALTSIARTHSPLLGTWLAAQFKMNTRIESIVKGVPPATMRKVFAQLCYSNVYNLTLEEARLSVLHYIARTLVAFNLITLDEAQHTTVEHIDVPPFFEIYVPGPSGVFSLHRRVQVRPNPLPMHNQGNVIYIGAAAALPQARTAITPQSLIKAVQHIIAAKSKGGQTVLPAHAKIIIGNTIGNLMWGHKNAPAQARRNAVKATMRRTRLLASSIATLQGNNTDLNVSDQLPLMFKSQPNKACELIQMALPQHRPPLSTLVVAAAQCIKTQPTVTSIGFMKLWTTAITADYCVSKLQDGFTSVTASCMGKFYAIMVSVYKTWQPVADEIHKTIQAICSPATFTNIMRVATKQILQWKGYTFTTQQWEHTLQHVPWIPYMAVIYSIDALTAVKQRTAMLNIGPWQHFFMAITLQDKNMLARRKIEALMDRKLKRLLGHKNSAPGVAMYATVAEAELAAFNYVHQPMLTAHRAQAVNLIAKIDGFKVKIAVEPARILKTIVDLKPHLRQTAQTVHLAFNTHAQHIPKEMVSFIYAKWLMTLVFLD